jgi:hypothetical protein
MASSNGSSRTDPLYAELMSAIVAALASGRHNDHHLLLVHERFLEMDRERRSQAGPGPSGGEEGDAHRRSLLRSFIGTPARTPLGIAAKLAVACYLDGHIEAAQEAPEGPNGSHVIVAAFMDAMAQARLLPAERHGQRH